MNKPILHTNTFYAAPAVKKEVIASAVDTNGCE